MQQTIHISTPAHNGLYDITRQVEAIVAESGVSTGLVNVYVQGATAGIMIPFKLMNPLFNSFRYLNYLLGPLAFYNRFITINYLFEAPLDL